MKRSENKILVTHAGRLERPESLTEQMAKVSNGRPADPEFSNLLRDAVEKVVKDQVDVGVDVVGDGEFGKLSWIRYISTRLAGLEELNEPRKHGVIEKDREKFAEYYRDAAKDGLLYFKRPSGDANQECAFTGPISYIGNGALNEDIRNLKAAAKKAGADEAFMPSTAPGSVIFENRYYKSEMEFLYALADALKVEYHAIVDAGLILHIDDPVITTYWDRYPDSTEKQRLAICEERIEVLNFALKGIPPDRVRLHICWGSWHGPHSTDVPLEVLVPLLSKMNVGAYVLEAGNVRHEHEWQVWKKSRLPEGRILIPGVVSHSTDTIEHPDLVAWRLQLFADVVGRENLIAGTDCGLGYRVHNQIAWAKLEALSEGAARATKQLWRRSRTKAS